MSRDPAMERNLNAEEDLQKNDFRFLNLDREGTTSAASAHRESSSLIMRQIPFLIEIFLMKRGFPLDP